MVIGVGNPWRGDDAAGLEVARRTGGVQHEGDCTRLLDAWEGHDDVVVVDAALSGAAPGTVHRVGAPLPVTLRSSSHAFGVAEAVELARALGRLPRGLRVCAIEGSDFALGPGLSPEVEAAVESLAAQLISGTIEIAPHGHSSAHRPQPLQ
jgi:hydrogenase maturation protease